LIKDGAVALLVALIILGWEASGGDGLLAQRYGDAQGFAAQHAAWATQLHNAGRWLAGLGWLACLVDALRPQANAASQRAAWAVVVGVLLAALLVTTIKRASGSACPWSLQTFGGTVAYASHWLQWDRTGQCFPSGHASAAFAFLPLYTLWRSHKPRFARAALGLTLVMGVCFGWLQVVRGAHFASHVMWSGWLCWMVAMGLQPLLQATQPAARALRVRSRAI
jgi:membrane-associated PAP2 superfamily phosphatase